MKLEELPIKGKVYGGWNSFFCPLRLTAVVYDIDNGVMYSSYPPITGVDDYQDVRSIGNGKFFEQVYDELNRSSDKVALSLEDFCRHFRAAEKEHIEEDD